MAILDTENDLLVIRIVYDGPPCSGKTTSLKALGDSLSRHVYTPEETGKRTVYFDWMDYTGGLFDGRQIRCQVVSVPGQTVLAPRRKRLIETADVVIFVGDTTISGINETIQGLKSLERIIKSLPTPRPGIILQANKRDCPGAMEAHDLRILLNKEVPGIGIAESVATEGFGVRQTFVFGIRLALDRIRELLRTGSLAKGRPAVDTGEELLWQLKAEESGALAVVSKTINRPPLNSQGEDSMPNEALYEVLIQEAPSKPEESYPERSSVINDHTQKSSAKNDLGHPIASTSIPCLPNSEVPGGMIWPPVDGRIILHEASAQKTVPREETNGDWIAEVGDSWLFHSQGNSTYIDVDQGRHALIHWAHLHIANSPVLSPRRCLVLADAKDGTWRLWQIIRVEKTLKEFLCEAFDDNDLEMFADRLWEVSCLLLQAAELISKMPYSFACHLETTGCIDSKPFYLGLAPMPDAIAENSNPPIQDKAALLRNEITSLLIPEITQRKIDILQVLVRLGRRSASQVGSQWILEALDDILEHS